MRFSYLLILLSFCSCTQTEYNKKPASEKGSNLRMEKDYQNFKGLADVVLSGVLDSCITHNKLGFDEMIKITPKLHVMINNADYNIKTCNFVNDKLGEIAQWNLVEAFKSRDQLLKIFRYKLISKKFDFPIELRITFTDLNKLTEYKFYQWKSSYSEDLVKMNWN